MRYRLIERTGLANSPTFSSRMFVDFADVYARSPKIAGDFLIEDQERATCHLSNCGQLPCRHRDPWTDNFWLVVPRPRNDRKGTPKFGEIVARLMRARLRFALRQHRPSG